MTFDKAFAPATIGSSSVATLRFTIANNLSLLAGNLAFTEPVGMEVASPSNAVNISGGEALNITSVVTGEIDGIAVEGRGASDILEIDSIVFTKSFGGPTQSSPAAQWTSPLPFGTATRPMVLQA